MMSSCFPSGINSSNLPSSFVFVPIEVLFRNTLALGIDLFFSESMTIPFSNFWLKEEKEIKIKAGKKIFFISWSEGKREPFLFRKKSEPKPRPNSKIKLSKQG